MLQQELDARLRHLQPHHRQRQQHLDQRIRLPSKMSGENPGAKLSAGSFSSDQ